MLIGNYFKKVNKKYRAHFFSGLSFNSQTCKKNCIFFAIKGNKSNGNKFIKKAIKNGARTIISSQDYEGLKNKILYIHSSNVRKSLADVVSGIYKVKPKNLIAVTGTNGKSSISNFYFQILRLNKKKVASIGTLGVQTIFNKSPAENTTLDSIKLAMCLEKIKKQKIDNVILEASSHGLKQHRLDGLEFKTGIFTNLSHDHLDYHKNFDDYLKSKLYLFNKLLKKNSNIITDIEIPEYKIIKKIAQKRKLKINTILNQNSSLNLISHKFFKNKQLNKIRYKNKIYKFQTNLIGKIQIKNILMAMLAAQKSGLKLKQIINVIDKIKPVNGRLEKVGNIKNNSKVILDYAHTPDALQICLENLKEQFINRKISIVFGCGGNRDHSKRAIMGKIANSYCNKIYITDDNPRTENPKKIRVAIKKNIDKSKVYEIPDRAKAIKKAILDLKTGDILVVAGKGHENIQDYGKKKKLFSDKKEILINIKKKNKNLFSDIKLNILKELSESKKISLQTKIKNASINSKEIKKNDIFFSIKGKKRNGNLFVSDALKRGASLAVVNNYENTSKKIKVKNTLSFLTKASSIIRENTSSKIIAITGSCGKTSLKELTGKTLSKISKTTYSPKSFNNKFGVPLSLFNLKQNDDFGVFEIGMDKKGEIGYLSKIIKPDVGVITNISYAHAKNFQNIQQIALAKSEIIKNIKNKGSIVLNADDQFYKFHKKIARKRKIKIYSFSLKKNNSDVFLSSIKKEKLKYKATININNFKKFFYINSNFESDIKNLLATITIISIYKDITKFDKNIFYDHKTPNGRGDITKIKLFKKKFYLVDESYNSNPLSLKSALKNFDMIKVHNSKKHLILGDMLELGSHSKKLHIEISKNINKKSLKNINVIGKYISHTYKNLNKTKKGLIFKKNSEIINLIKSNINNNDYLMIKASNSTGLNKLANDLKIGKINAL
ncbi:UDP-N-acetylmuramoyl-L-alanyl-D-glutamate--2,6-diaminopimelate ligase [Pelagibacterales bacterium SAG-MED20]|nr:UDP-N-acetylmuramoyl-L-alanyl-D-glutamate--2,6-diaminopimelate ligase [Pelagibacterales bacterium SAG-MED20]